MFNRNSVITIAIKGALCSLLIFIRIAIFQTCTLSGLNYSLVMNCHAITPFLIAYSFYVLYSESLNHLHIFGIVLIFFCVLITGFSSTTDSESEEGTISAWIPIGLVLLMCLLSAFSAVLIRFISLKTNIPMS